MPVSATKSYLEHILITDPELVIPGPQIYLREHAGSLKLVKQVINARQWILVLYSDTVQHSVIDAHPQAAILLLYKQYRYSPR